MRNFAFDCAADRFGFGGVAGRFGFGCAAALTAIMIAFSAASAVAAPATTQPAATEAGAKTTSAKKSASARQVRSVRKSSRQAVRSKAKIKATVTAKQSDKSRTDKPVEAAQATEPGQFKDHSIPLPASIANANAEMIEFPAPVEAKPAEPANEAVAPAKEAKTVETSNEINDLDRAAMSAPRMKTINAGFEMRDETDFAQTSLIGRIFIAIGALLLIGSAVRMVIR